MNDILKGMAAGEPATADQAGRIVDDLMAGSIDPVVAGSFLALQMRNGIDAGQLNAALEVMMRYATTIAIADREALDNCGTGGDGGLSFNVSTTAAFVIAAAGHTVAKHGNRAVSSTCGSADLLEALGVRLDLEPESVRRCIDENGIGFMFAPVFHPAMKHAAPIRRALGMRTMFNLLGPLANPARVNRQLIGVFHESLTELLGKVLAAQGRTAFVVCGGDGGDEISLTTPTRVTEVREGGIETWIFDPRRHGFSLVTAKQLAGGDLARNREIFDAILKGQDRGPAHDLVVLNAGFAMFTSGRYGTLDEAFMRARTAISSGRAFEKVAQLIQWTASAAAH